MVVVGAVTVNDTETVWGVLVAPVAVTVIVAENDPATSPAVLTDRTTGLDPVVVLPEVGDRVSQEALSETDQESVPVPGLVIFNVFEPGFAPPCTPVNEKVVGLNPIVGEAVTVKDTGMFTDVAPGALMVTVAL